ncbi:NUDIX hydrolase [Celeribacter marinus]|uniref:Hydrolase, NUDIX family n=1 Tax=Celeribacter marinus TaxID=1397108 RepID=A0A0P0AA59_9RHOB|nr:NUDIX hydrolase [Celeribacter marinus]ALI55010.1 hydrolase, NUDIX family [Celeribacter marinus]SFK04656.1 8-oxo-dGTP pyrophosphatase MutT, NUDIX family [Celeribacter marinus]
MVTLLKSALGGVFNPFFRRPNRVQSAALCYRKGESGKEVLLISSRGTGRWILPKGWPIDGKDGAGTAAQEAWEEAGVQPSKVKAKPLGQYNYDKLLNNGASAPVTATVYSIKVEGMADTYPESTQRTRNWMPASEAAELVDEPELKDILRAF